VWSITTAGVVSVELSHMVSVDEMERYTVDDVGRIYVDGDQWLPSVSTVLDMRPMPPALRRWIQNNDDSEEIKAYKQNRGTIFHYDCLQQLVPRVENSDEPTVDLWSGDEQTSIDTLRGSDNWDRFRDERSWIEETWDLMTDIQGITRESVIDVETYVVNRDIGYGGQFDLLYQDHSADETVLADIKSGKSVYEKNLIQLTSYKRAVDAEIDRMEILRMNPDQSDWEISSSHDWLDDEDDLWSEFVELRGQLEAERMDAIKAHIRDELDSSGSGDVLIESTG